MSRMYVALLGVNELFMETSLCLGLIPFLNVTHDPTPHVLIEMQVIRTTLSCHGPIYGVPISHCAKIYYLDCP